MRRGIIACSGMIVTLVLLVVSLLGPWYTLHGSGAVGMNYEVDLFLTRMDAQGTLMGQSISYSVRYADAQENAQNTGLNTDSFSVINNAMFLTVAACITAVVAIIGMVAYVLQNGRQQSIKYLGGLFGILTFILSLLPAWYFMMTGFAQNNTGFWFSQTVLGLTYSGGPGYAWYLMIVAAIIAVISAVMILLKKSGSDAAANIEKIVPPS
jgi:hypothetical protein